MPTTLNPTCPLCGLRYTDRPLLELHLREDHFRRDHRAEPPPGDSGDTAAAATPARRPGRPRPGWARTAPHRAVWALRYANQELTRACEALSLRRRVNGHGGNGVAGGGRA
jgi:hypothetical protein